MKTKLRIGINAQIPRNSGGGGIETVLHALTALARLDDGDEEYIFIGHWSDPDWLKPFLGESGKTIAAPRPKETRPTAAEILKRPLGRLRPFAGKIKRAFAAPSKSSPTQMRVGASDGFYESLNCGVIHFPYQDYVSCDVPTVYNPHDLQHLHFPQFFSPAEIQRRETIYPAACRAAETIVVASRFVKQDVMRNYNLAAEKIRVIAWSPPEIAAKKSGADDSPLSSETSETSKLPETSEISKLSEKYRLPAAPFALYPAMTWEHKNHIRLLEAVALLRERENLRVNVVCTGHKTAFWSQIERRRRDLNLENQVVFCGLVSHEELSALYGQAQLVIVPTLFEAASAPLFEAWQHDVAVACSSVTALPEQAAGAALLFNPFAVEEIAGALRKMTLDAKLRADFRAKGTKRLRDFSLERTAKAYRAVYRKAAGLKLNDADIDLLNESGGEVEESEEKV